jgi:Zn-finger nucleic acid-binding protein
MSERHGVEIDYCPQCRGVWLDRGELDKILERNNRDSAPAAAIPRPAASDPGYGRDHDHIHGYRKRKKSFLEELFD